MNRLFFPVILIVLAFTLSGCEIAWQLGLLHVPQQTALVGPAQYAGINKVSYRLSNYKRNALAVHRISFINKAGNLETYRAVLKIPVAYRFLGFTSATRPAGKKIGQLTFDWKPYGSTDHVIPIYSLGKKRAYADIGKNGAFTAGREPIIRYQKAGSKHKIIVVFPLGGDNNAATLTGFGPMKISFQLNKGVFRNPRLPRKYKSIGVFTSVDPDTDGPNNHAGTAPTTKRFPKTVTIK